MSLLTPPQPTLIIPTLVQQVPAWNDSHEKHKMPIARLINRLRFKCRKIYLVDVFVGTRKRAGFLCPVCYPTLTFTAQFLAETAVFLNQSQEVNHNVTA